MSETSASNSSPTASANSITRSAVTGLAALGAVFSLPTAVDAAVVYSGIQNISATLPPAGRHASNGAPGSSGATAALNLDGLGVNDFRLRARQFSNGGGFRSGAGFIEPLVGGNVIQGGYLGGGDGGEGAFNLKSSAFVPGSFGSINGFLRNVRQAPPGSKFASGSFANGVAGFVGVHFDQGGQTHYGWIRLKVDDGAQGFPYQVTAIDWAYESNPQTRIHVELQVPEANPGMVLLAAGGTGLAAWRLRRRKTTTAAEPVSG